MTSARVFEENSTIPMLSSGCRLKKKARVHHMKTLAHISLKSNDRKAIEAAKDLLVQKYPVELIVLYGSKARGTDEAESDIDLLVLTKRELTWRERNTITDALYDIQLSHGVVISTLVVPIREWSEGRYSVLPIHDEVKGHGVAA